MDAFLRPEAYPSMRNHRGRHPSGFSGKRGFPTLKTGRGWLRHKAASGTSVPTPLTLLDQQKLFSAVKFKNNLTPFNGGYQCPLNGIADLIQVLLLLLFVDDNRPGVSFITTDGSLEYQLKGRFLWSSLTTGATSFLAPAS